MIKKIDAIILDDAEHGVESLWIDFRSNFKKSSRVNFIDVPESVPYDIETQITDDGEITVIDIVDFPEFAKHMWRNTYLPNLGLFTYEDSEPLPLEQIIINYVIDNFVQVA
jgi:hypothetical protein